MGLRTVRGDTLQRLIATLGAVAFLLQGYNQSMMNGLLTLNDFLKVLPGIDTIHTTGAQKAHNLNIQGTLSSSNWLISCPIMLIVNCRSCRVYIRSWLRFWRVVMFFHR